MADKWLTFDCYGTVADWNSGMGGALAGLAGVSGADAGRLLTAYHQAELEIEADPRWRSYREVLTAALARAAERERVRLPRGGEEAFVRGWPDIPVFDDAGPALATLKERGWRLAFLTNCDEDLFATTRSLAARSVRRVGHRGGSAQLQAGPPALQEVRRENRRGQGGLDPRGQQLGARYLARGPDGAALRVGGPGPHRAPRQARGPADHQHAQAARGSQGRERHST